MTVGPRDLSRLLSLLADEPETVQSITGAGVVRRAARTLLELDSRVASLEAEVDELTGDRASDGCQTCGEPLSQRPTGRTRLYCDDTCKRSAASKLRRKSS